MGRTVLKFTRMLSGKPDMENHFWNALETFRLAEGLSNTPSSAEGEGRRYRLIYLRNYENPRDHEHNQRRN